ncbi:MAG: GlpM family protein [Chromatiales bacterium]|jgi:membrane protein GlpM
MEILIKALIGAGAAVLIHFLSHTKSFYISGLVPLFPTFALIAHYIVGTNRPVEDLRTTIIFGAWSMLPYLVYLAAVYVLFVRSRLSLSVSLVGATLVWSVAATILVIAWSRSNSQLGTP